MSSPVRPFVSIITVNYNQTKVTLEWLHSVRNISYPNYEIIIVDNASADDSLEAHLRGQPDVIFIRSGMNKGFAGGNNLGIEKAKGDLLLLLNNDTEVEPGFLEPLVNCIQGYPEAGMVSPKVKYYFQPDTIQYAGGVRINPLTGRGRFIGSGESDHEKYRGTKTTELIHGSAMLVSRRLINKVGLMEECFFLYYEELDWSERAKRAGYTLHVCGQSVVYHKESMSVGKNSPLRVYYTTRNRILFMKRNFPGFSFIIYLLFFMLVSLPKNIIAFLLRGEVHLLKAFVSGIISYGQVSTTDKIPAAKPVPPVHNRNITYQIK